jgi:hypothetical protein
MRVVSILILIALAQAQGWDTAGIPWGNISLSSCYYYYIYIYKLGINKLVSSLLSREETQPFFLKTADDRFIKMITPI